MLSRFPNRDPEIARLAALAEIDAINLYTQLAQRTKDPLLREVLLDVADEERTHLNEFLITLFHVSPKDEQAYWRALKEVCEIAEKHNIHLEACKVNL